MHIYYIKNNCLKNLLKFKNLFISAFGKIFALQICALRRFFAIKTLLCTFIKKLFNKF